MTLYTVETGVEATFSASHNDQVRKELHGHSYKVTAWFRYDEPRDAVVLQERLKAVVKNLFDHKTLPPELSRGEDMARAIIQLLDGCVGVDISRPLEGIHVKVRV